MDADDILQWLIDDDSHALSDTRGADVVQMTADEDECLELLDWQNGSDEDDLLADADQLDARKPLLLDRLEQMVLQLLEQLSSSLPKPELEDAKSRMLPTSDEFSTKASTCVALELVDRKRLSNIGHCTKRTIRFPQNKRRGNARGLATLFRVIELSHGSLLNGVSASKRDIYYQDVALFQTQATVNNLVDDLAATCGVARSDLHIEAACKGLWCGAGLSMISRTGSVIAGQHNEPTLIPVQTDIQSIQLAAEVAWILVVEKDAVFQTLCRAGVTTHPKLPGHGILITGKGYPDVATRDLVAALSRYTTVPLLALVDADAHGVDIFSCYKYGSRNLQHEQDRLQALRLEWIGVWSTDLNRLGLDKDELLPLSARDLKKAISLLLSPNRAHEPLWRLYR